MSVTITATPKFSSDFTNNYILSRDSLEVSLENVPHYLSFRRRSDPPTCWPN